MTPPDHDGGLVPRLLALVGTGGAISTAADTVLHSIPAGAVVERVT